MPMSRHRRGGRGAVARRPLPRRATRPDLRPLAHEARLADPGLTEHHDEAAEPLPPTRSTRPRACPRSARDPRGWHSRSRPPCCGWYEYRSTGNLPIVCPCTKTPPRWGRRLRCRPACRARARHPTAASPREAGAVRPTRTGAGRAGSRRWNSYTAGWSSDGRDRRGARRVDPTAIVGVLGGGVARRSDVGARRRRPCSGRGRAWTGALPLTGAVVTWSAPSWL